MKTTLILLSTVFAIVIIAGGIALVGTHRSNRTLENENRRLAGELGVAEVAAAALRAEQQQNAERLTAAQELSTSLLTKLAETEAANPKSTVAPEVKPYQATAYLGQALLSPVWIVPHNLRMDTNAQRYVYEPVVVLDERYRGSFVTYQTNIVEREVAKTYVDHNYYAATYFTDPAYYYPPRYPQGSNHFPRPLPKPLPAQPLPPQPKFKADSSGVMQQKLMIPADQIKTLPIGR
jgi:hypothetical protein